MSEKKQVIKNLLVNIVSLSSRMLLGLWLAPYLVEHIGVAAYGFVPVAAILTEYVTIVTGSINSAISRYLIIHIQEENWHEANKTFNTALVTNFAMFGIQIPIFALLLFNLASVFTIPPELKEDVFYLVAFSMAAFSMTVFSSVFSTSLFAKNRLDLMRLLDIVTVVIRATTIIVCFSVDTPKLYYVGLGEVLAAVVTLFMYSRFWRKLTPLLKMKPSSFDKGRLKEILAMSIWLLINWVGTLLFTRTDLIVANRFVGADQAGQYAAVQQWSNVVTALIIILSMLTSPLVLTAYAKKDFPRMKFVVQTSMKLFGVFVSVIVGILMVQSESLLTIWIGSEIAKLFPLLIILIVHLSINLAIVPLFTVFTAYNRVKVPGTATLVAGGINFGLAVLLSSYFNLGIYGIATAGLIMLTIKNAVLTPLYTSYVMKESYMDFYAPLFKILLSTGLVFLVALPIRWFTIDSWLDLVISSAIAGIVSLPLIWLLIFTAADREFIINLVPDGVRRRFARKS